jgi:DNA modification methylase
MNRVIFGDCRDTMRDLRAQGVRVQCCVTSPPYFGLRDYGHPGQIGLEKTPAEYVAALVEVFDGVRELLADDGVLWLNLGDSYATQGGRGEARMEELGRPTAGAKTEGRWRGTTSGTKMPQGMKPKDLMGIPWRVAFALQAAGWYLRQDIIWHKPNPMPESVTDRCTKAHEYLFLMTKSERYFWDSEAMREPFASDYSADAIAKAGGAGGERPAGDNFNKAARQDGAMTPRTRAERAALLNPAGRNRRSVWTVPTQPYAGAHFAVFPAALIEPCVLAGSRPGDVVLDPFMGSGTTAQVAQALGRQWIGCELNTEYAPLQQARTAQAALAI